MSSITTLRIHEIKQIITDLKCDHGDEIETKKECHLQLLQDTTKYIPTGLAIMDKLLNGGMQTGSIIEINGPPAGGKTQLVNTITANFCAEGHRCYYIDTKMDFSAIRSERIVSSKVEESEVLNVLARILVQRTFKLPELIECLDYLFDIAVTNNETAQLVVIDSLSALTADYVGGDYQELQALIDQFVKGVRKLAIKRNFIVLFTTIPSKSGGAGHSWEKLPSHKLYVDRVVTDPEKLVSSVVRNDPRRILELLKGPEDLMTSKRKFIFTINDNGCVVTAQDSQDNEQGAPA